jgi:uncharacterized protein
MTLASAIYVGTVTHQRLRPVRHRLSYRVFALLIDLDELPHLHRTLHLFSRGRFNLYAFHDRDHGDGLPGRRGEIFTECDRPVRPQDLNREDKRIGLRTDVDRRLAAAGITDCNGPVRILCYPRILGYVFNPLSTYFCHRADGTLGAILYEVNNTFGDRHCYAIPVTPDCGSPIEQGCAKALHVSPFLDMDMAYRFRILPPGEGVAVGITAEDGNGPVLTASFGGRRQALTDVALARLFLRYPLMTAKVIAGIHWEALRLWRKGVPIHRRPSPSASPPAVAPPLTMPNREIADA